MRPIPFRRTSRFSLLLALGCLLGHRPAAAQQQTVVEQLAPLLAAEDAREFLVGAGLDAAAIAPQVDGKFMSAFVRARKPAAA